ncbi:MAG: hypothetical protein EZS28_041129 [Streblomastix strix]|uniref:Uncharacterized protein n=1 Tax=Streblomastix strix TaxID=222440 RepID=A0A5J4U0X1_9EUKA|nr:MAG: hypothetical protein EZS28_041129 [Streblomastix strix]
MTSPKKSESQETRAVRFLSSENSELRAYIDVLKSALDAKGSDLGIGSNKGNILLQIVTYKKQFDTQQKIIDDMSIKLAQQGQNEQIKKEAEIEKQEMKKKLQEMEEQLNIHKNVEAERDNLKQTLDALQQKDQNQIIERQRSDTATQKLAEVNDILYKLKSQLKDSESKLQKENEKEIQTEDNLLKQKRQLQDEKDDAIR